MLFRSEDLSERITVVSGAEVLLLRERILPLLRFASLLGAAGAAAAALKALEIAVVTTGSLSYGLVVGAFHDTEEIVVKPLGRHLKALREYAGATILGDGRVALILDIDAVMVPKPHEGVGAVPAPANGGFDPSAVPASLAKVG